MVSHDAGGFSDAACDLNVYDGRKRDPDDLLRCLLHYCRVLRSKSDAAAQDALDRVVGAGPSSAFSESRDTAGLSLLWSWCRGTR